MQPIHEQVKTDTALPMRFTVYDSDNDLIPMHWHNSLEIVYILAGTMDVTINDHVTRLFAGDSLLAIQGKFIQPIVSALHGFSCCSSLTTF